MYIYIRCINMYCVLCIMYACANIIIHTYRKSINMSTSYQSCNSTLAQNATSRCTRWRESGLAHWPLPKELKEHWFWIFWSRWAPYGYQQKSVISQHVLLVDHIKLGSSILPCSSHINGLCSCFCSSPILGRTLRASVPRRISSPDW